MLFVIHTHIYAQFFFSSKWIKIDINVKAFSKNSLTYILKKTCYYIVNVRIDHKNCEFEKKVVTASWSK